MKRILTIITTSLIVIPTVGWGALPPAAESLRKIKTIAESPVIFEKLNAADQVTGITQTKEGYTVTTEHCKLHVQLQATDLSQLEPTMVGPAKLEVLVTDIKCQKPRKKSR